MRFAICRAQVPMVSCWLTRTERVSELPVQNLIIDGLKLIVFKIDPGSECVVRVRSVVNLSSTLRPGLSNLLVEGETFIKLVTCHHNSDELETTPIRVKTSISTSGFTTSLCPCIKVLETQQSVTGALSSWIQLREKDPRRAMGGTSSAVVTLFCMLTGLLVVFALHNWSGGRFEGALSEIQHRDLSETVILPQQSGGLYKCNRTCGNITFPYPFGFSSECALSRYFQLECVYTTGVTGVLAQYELGEWPFLEVLNGSYQDNNGKTHNVSSFQVLEVVGSAGTLVIDTTNIKGTSCYYRYNGTSGSATILLPESGPYLSTSSNVFAVVGCNSDGQLTDGSGDVNANCGPISCNNQFNSAQFQVCGLYDCCTLSMQPMANIYLSGGGISYTGYSTCGYSSVVYPPSFSADDAGVIGDWTYGMQLQWAVQVNESLYSNCSAVEKTQDYICSPTPATCQFIALKASDPNVPTLNGYHCACTQDGYVGDGYKNGTGCDDIDECTNPNLNKCDIDSGANCINLLGSYNCTCPTLKEGDGFRNSTGCSYVDFCLNVNQNNCTQEARCDSSEGLYNCTCPNGMVGDGLVNGTGCKSKSQTALIAGVVSSGVFVGIVVNGFVIWWILRYLRRRHLERLVGFSDSARRKFLTEIQSKEGANICKLFSLEELVKATNNFSKDRVVGTGGFGTVYQGTLADGTPVAVKIAKREGGAGGHDDTKQFINEVTILSQVNHRTLVKLLGCCLDTPIPILVYDFISNGNLQAHLKRSRPNLGSSESPDELTLQPLNWDHRLKIAVGTAEALSYLHFGTFPPIYHRDVKTANILLDDNYSPKVADFGLSKLVPVDATHLSTANFGGTPGYMDPGFFDNYQITDKSDVYSFGVVLLELVTGEKPVDLSQPEKDQNLAVRCTQHFLDGSFEDMIDPYLDTSSEPTIVEDVLAVAEVAIKCVKRKYEDRPSMKEVWNDLQKLSRPKPSLLANNGRKTPRPAKSVRFDQLSTSLLSQSTTSEEFGFSSNPESYSGRSSSISLSTTSVGRR